MCIMQSFPGERLIRDCELGRAEKRMMRQAYDRFSLNARTYHKVLKVARTIADLEGEERIGIEHLQEALVYRSMVRSIGEEYERYGRI